LKFSNEYLKPIISVIYVKNQVAFLSETIFLKIISSKVTNV